MPQQQQSYVPSPSNNRQPHQRECNNDNSNNSRRRSDRWGTTIPSISDPLDGFLDDLISLGSSSGMQPQDSGSISTPMSPVGDRDSYFFSLSPTWRLSNPVHMELQENAKLPTFNLPVDRTGSAFPRRTVPGEYQFHHDRHDEDLMQQQQQQQLSPSSSLPPHHHEEDQQQRSSSSHHQQQHHQQEPRVSPTNMMRETSLGEHFLQSSHRRTMNATYAQAGTLQQHYRTSMGGGGGNYGGSLSSPRLNSSARGTGGMDETRLESDSLSVEDYELAAEVEPTPLSEIRRKQEVRERMGYYPYQGGRYHRSVPLPIPMRNQSPPIAPSSPQSANSSRSTICSPVRHMAEALATAAAIASQEQATGGEVRPPSPPLSSPISSPKQHHSLHVSASTSDTGTTTEAHQQQQRHQHHNHHQSASSSQQQHQHQQQSSASTQRQHEQHRSHDSSPVPFQPPISNSNSSNSNSRAYSPPQHHARTVQQHAGHGAAPSAIERASTQKSQYGFGPKHVVPSVPASLEAVKQQQRNNRGNPSSPVPPSISLSGNLHNDNDDANNSGSHANTGPAYERKKQRAKDARVRLNESIEKLAIAINFAGSQSRQRVVHWNSLPPLSSVHKQVGMRIIQDCAQTAESAKKWDRPSFVGTAASLIQNLSAQCEMLTRELSNIHGVKEVPVAAGASIAVAVSEEEKCLTNGETPLLTEKRRLSADGSVAAEDGAGSSKRQKSATTTTTVELANGRSLATNRSSAASSTGEIVSGGEERSLVTTLEGSIWGESKLIMHIASFLEPATLGRLNLVSKAFRREFSRCERWYEMAFERFGQYNVRQWQGKLDDEEEGIKCTNFKLYSSMDRSNTIPHFGHDGMFLLGEARLSGKVSAWTFLVQRSNGETLRSVIRHGSMPGNTVFTSLPIVELRTVIQNTGSHEGEVLIREQLQTVDASTRRRGVEMNEVHWDDRFRKRILNLDWSTRPADDGNERLNGAPRVLCRLRLFEAVVLVTYIHAKGCSTTSKFVQRSNFTRILVQISNGTTVPLVIPFPRDASHHLER